MKKISIVVTLLCLLTGMQSVAQINPLAQKSLRAMTGQVPSAFSTNMGLSVRSASMLGNRITKVQFALQDATYLSSAELFGRVQASRVFSQVPAVKLHALENKFSHLDAVAVTHPQSGYVSALHSMSPALSAELAADSNVAAMIDVLNIQQYMRLNDNQFPEIYTILSGGWLSATSCLDSMEGNRAFLGVVSILVKEQTGEVSPAVVEQLVALHAQARNVPTVQDVLKGLQEWQQANRSSDAPKLPTNMEGLSLRNNPETLWLTTEIRLLQLTPNIELPEVLKNAKVTQ